MGLHRMKTRVRSSGLLATGVAGCAVLLAGCSGISSDMFTSVNFAPSKYGVSASPRVTLSRTPPKGGGRYQVGQPYTIAGKRYVPREQPDLNITGTASWYGPNFHGRKTANGEVFDQYHLSGAHPTLPLPSYVRVTNVDNGRSVVVRINDRGPYAHGRVVDVSRRTAEVLGFKQQGIGNVRVQYVGPAPLQGDDTRFLMASIDTPTQIERQGVDSRMAMQDIQVAQASPMPTPAPVARPADAIGNLISQAPAQPAPSDVPFQILSYAGTNATLDIAGAHDAAGRMAPGSGLAEWQASMDEEARRINLGLGVFTDMARAGEVAALFAAFAAVEEAQIDVNGRPAIQLSLSYLKPGVLRSDIFGLARELGLNDYVLYE